MTMQVMSSMTVSFSRHLWAAARTRALPALSGEFFRQYGWTMQPISWLERYSKTPSLAITMNLSRLLRSKRVTSGSGETPTVWAIMSPIDLLIASPGISASRSQTRLGPKL